MWSSPSCQKRRRARCRNLPCVKWRKPSASRRATLAIALTGLLTAAFALPIADWVAVFFAWVQANPTIAWAVFIAFYVAAVVLMLPGSLLTLGAGYLFGLGYGFVIVSLASTVGATCAFLSWTLFCVDWVRRN